MLAARSGRRRGNHVRSGDLGFWRRVDVFALRSLCSFRDRARPASRHYPPGQQRQSFGECLAKFELAEVDIETFDRLFAAESLALGAEVRGKDVLPLLAGDLRPEMVEALRRVKSTFKTGCITNNLPANAIGSAGGRTLYIAEVMTLFDHIIESAKIGLRKPDPKIYRMMVEALGVDPKRCIYLDDLGINLKPAREMGMTTIKVVGAKRALAELEAATGLSLQ
jgi:putative hydrolase of the HAD superfamily